MRKIKIYLETTLFNYYFDTDRDGHPATVRMFEAIGRGDFEGYTSEYAIIELNNAETEKQAKMKALIEKYGIIVLQQNNEADTLANLYIQNKIIQENKFLDAAHITIASIHSLNTILSFNFKHINKLKTKTMTENINLLHGYKGITICTPMEVFDDEETEYY